MARVKHWSDEDRAAALEWIEGKARTGAVFKGHGESNATALERLARITDLTDFAAAVQATLTQAAHRRLLGALRQRKHQASVDAQADEQTAQGGDEQLKARVRSLEAELASTRAGSDSALATASNVIVERDQEISLLKTEVERLKARLREKTETRQNHIEAEASGLMFIHGADELVDVDEAVLLAALSIAVQRKATYVLEWVNVELMRRAQREPVQAEVDDEVQAEVVDEVQSISLTPHQRAALLLARAHIEDGQTEADARAKALKSTNATGELTDATIKQLLKDTDGQDITPASRQDRDQVILVMAGGLSNYKVGGLLGCSEGTVRNVIKRASKASA